MIEVTGEAHKRTKVFISYSHEDAQWLQRLRVHLRPLEREQRIEIWDDTRIKPGSRWREEIRQAIATAKVVVLLVSADFLASDFIATAELPPLLCAAEKEGALILSVILSPSTFSSTILAQFQAVNDPSNPLVDATKGEQESVLVKATLAIEASLDDSPTIVTKQSQKGETTRSHRTKESRKKQSVGKKLALAKQSELHPVVWIAVIGAIASILVIGYCRPQKTSRTQTVDEILAEAKTWPVVFEDGFADNSKGWLSSDGNVHPALKSDFNGRLNFSIPTTDGRVDEAFYSPKQVDNEFYVVLDAVTRDGSTGCYYGVVFKGNIKGEYYTFRIAEHYYLISLHSSKRKRFLTDWVMLPQQVKNASQAMVVAKGARYLLYLDSHFVTEFTDSQLAGRSVGIEVTACKENAVGTFAFDNFEVRAPLRR